jgi:hypothetical protein
MLHSPQGSAPPLALGLMSIVLGMIGAALFFLPILGMPISACGIVVGLAGMLRAAFGDRSEARASIVGFAVSCAALAMVFAIDYAPIGYEPSDAVPRLWQTPAGPAYVPPPMTPGAGN